jgi:hypothetical protein
VNRPLFSSPLFWATTASFALALGFGCSSSSSSPTTGTGADAAGGDASTAADTAASDDAHPADGAHDGGAPDALYGACALKGGFGWPCGASATGPDPADCTDPNFPVCFVGGQGNWCTKTCASLTDCTTPAPSGGCVPVQCNGRGLCK